MKSERSNHYLRMRSQRPYDDDDQPFLPEQFERPKPKVPWKSIMLATGLFVIGAIFLIMGSLLFTGIIQSEVYGDRWIPFLVLGSILFIPGFYHVRIAYMAYRGYVGYEFDMIPEY